ncbi:MAG: histidine--tRNA ligase [Deltaproteobacteria bacterium]|nr:histidine--tRNA ligase [Deltaproteobacteria bacterium]
MAITSIRGFNDILPGESEVFQHIEREARRILEAYGFSEIRIPILERTELFSRSIGETTDIVEKEMYTFSDRKGESITLRPEGTAPVVRAYIEHKLFARNPITKLYYMGPMFRYERPQKGRYRQFYQIGVETLGTDDPRLDAETLDMLFVLFKRLSLEDVELYINSMGCKDCRPIYGERLKDFLKDKRDLLCKDCQRRFEVNPLRVLDCKNPTCIDVTTVAPSILDYICKMCQDHFEKVKEYLTLFGVRYSINPRMVRGLDYYTKTTFEVRTARLGAQNAVAAGGSYDGLVQELGGPHTPGFGFAIGVERLAILLKGKAIGMQPLVFLVTLGDNIRSEAFRLIKRLRGEGIRVEAAYGEKGLKTQLRRADKLGARFAIILGEDELASGEVTLKDMETGEQRRVGLDRVEERLIQIMSY